MRIASSAARHLGLVGCVACELVSEAAGTEDPGFCPRCGERLAFRRPRSQQIASALLVTAAICYVPANVLPVLQTTSLGSTENDTILEGVMLLYNSGSWPLALIVLVASVMIPLGKMTALAYLLLYVRRGGVREGHDQARLYHVVEIIGRWSMLDVFVDAYTVALVQLQPMISVAPGPGIMFFAAVVVLTMLAAEYFDPRLIWDGAEKGVKAHGSQAAS
jgi:paraquat-inducible protein A